jgi:hypothetical protein
MRALRRIARVLFAVLGLTLGGVTIANDVSAIIGRPLTPVSFAGVARRTVRRSAYYNYNYPY